MTHTSRCRHTHAHRTIHLEILHTYEASHCHDPLTEEIRLQIFGSPDCRVFPPTLLSFDFRENMLWNFGDSRENLFESYGNPVHFVWNFDSSKYCKSDLPHLWTGMNDSGHAPAAVATTPRTTHLEILHAYGAWHSHDKHMNESWHTLAAVATPTCTVPPTLEVLHAYEAWHNHDAQLWHTYEWVMTHVWMSYDTRMDESWHTYEWVMTHVWMSHDRTGCCRHTHAHRTTHLEILHAYEAWLSRNTHMNESWHECTPMSHETHVNDTRTVSPT